MVHKSEKLGQYKRKFVALPIENVRTDPAWLKELIVDNQNNDLPCFLSAALFNSIIRSYVVEDWVPLCEDLMEDAKNRISKIAFDAFSESIPSSRYATLGHFARGLIQNTLESTAPAMEAKVSSALDMDCNPYTQNHYLFENINKKRNDRIKHRVLNALGGDGDITRSGARDMMMSIFDSNQRMSMQDHVAQEMEIALDSYGKVAAKRVIDNVPMHVQAFIRDFLIKLEEAFSSVTDEKLSEIIFDEPSFKAKYKNAKSKFEKLKKAKQHMTAMSGL